MVARNRIVISGTIAGGLEQWSCGMDYRVPVDGSITDPGDLQTWAVNAANYLDDAETNQATITGIMGGNVNADTVSVYGYDATGPAVGVGQANFTWLGGGSISKPFSTAMCVTKRTGQAGRRYRGRCYWPVLACTSNSDGTIVIDTDLPEEFRTMFLAIGETAPAGVFAIPVVYSAVGNVVTDVTLLSIGDVPDSQRNRRDNLTETYLDSTPF